LGGGWSSESRRPWGDGVGASRWDAARGVAESSRRPWRRSDVDAVATSVGSRGSRVGGPCVEVGREAWRDGTAGVERTATGRRVEWRGSRPGRDGTGPARTLVGPRGVDVGSPRESLAVPGFEPLASVRPL
jgi:hypothetical protein